MRHDEKNKARFAELVSMAGRVNIEKGDGYGSYISNEDLASQWATSTSSLLKRIFGAESPHYTRFSATVGKDMDVYAFVKGTGILRAAQDDYNNGHLDDVRRSIEAEVHDELLEHAERLLSAGHAQAVAVIAGCVLEGALRSRCAAEGITPTSTIEGMNTALFEAYAYNAHVRRQVSSLAAIRDRAMRGEVTSSTERDVDAMLRDVRSLLAGPLGP